MIANIPQHGPMHPMAHRPAANRPETPAAAAPGQAAKTMIAEAVAGGAELPANIQGKAASAIAHGINMESFFAAFMPVVEPPANDVPAGGESAPPGDTGDVATPEPESGAASPPAPALADEAAASLIGAVASSYEIAATLLEPPEQPETGEVV